MFSYKTGIAVLLMGALPALAFAQATPNIDKREARQENRIQQGVKSGELTPREAARLQKGQARVQRMEAKAKADGTVTAKERARIERQQNLQSRRIARQKHDQQKQ